MMNISIDSKLADQAAEQELEALALEGLSSGQPIEAGPQYWQEKHRRLDERHKRTDGAKTAVRPWADAGHKRR